MKNKKPQLASVAQIRNRLAEQKAKREDPNWYVIMVDDDGEIRHIITGPHNYKDAQAYWSKLYDNDPVDVIQNYTIMYIPPV